MAISQAVCTSFKKELLEGAHDFRAVGTGDTFKIALYTSSASIGSSTTAYTASGETSGTGYSAQGQELAQVAPTTSSTTALIDFADEVFSTVSITARGALIFNNTPTHTYTRPSVLVLDFGGDKTASAGDFTIVFPTADVSNAILRIT